MAPLLLASASPRRTALLRLAGVEHSVAPVDCDERWIAGERAPDYARRIALAKAQLALTRGHPGLILAADTAVWIEPDAAPLGKPTDRQDARDMLRRLFSAGRHHVTTAFALIDGARRVEMK